jgi:hypothetical protein
MRLPSRTQVMASLPGFLVMYFDALNLVFSSGAPRDVRGSRSQPTDRAATGQSGSSKAWGGSTPATAGLRGDQF